MLIIGIQKRNINLKLNTYLIKKSLPNALIIGAAKCGTTALIEFLSVHPRVAVSHREIDYFSNLENYKKGLVS
jgi:hypothetical protein